MSRSWLIAIILFLALSLPLVVYITQQSQDIRQRAISIAGSPLPLSELPTPTQIFKPEMGANKRPIGTTNLPAVQKLLTWLSNRRNEDNRYSARTIRQTATSPELNGAIDDRMGVYVAWARYINWKKTKDATTLQDLRHDLETQADPEKVPTYQPDFYSCRLLYEMWLDQELPNDVREAADSLCQRAAVVVPELKERILLKSTIPINEVPEKNLEDALNPSGSKITDTDTAEELERKVKQYAAYASDFAAQAWWKDEPYNATIAQALFNLALDNYQQLVATAIPQGACVLGMASLDLYHTTREDKYLTFSKRLLDKVIEDQRFLQDRVFKKATCALLSQKLGRVTPQDSYQNIVNNLLPRLSEMSDTTTGAYFDAFGQSRVSEVIDNVVMLDVLANQ